MQIQKSRGVRRLRLFSLALAVDLALAIVNVPGIASGQNPFDSATLMPADTVRTATAEKSMEETVPDVVDNEVNLKVKKSALQKKTSARNKRTARSRHAAQRKATIKSEARQKRTAALQNPTARKRLAAKKQRELKRAQAAKTRAAFD